MSKTRLERYASFPRKNATLYRYTVTRWGSQVTGGIVALKEVALSPGDGSFRALKGEVDLMAQLSNAHIVQYLGAELDESARLLLIFQEWVPGGSIDSLLGKYGGRFRDSVTRAAPAPTLRLVQ